MVGGGLKNPYDAYAAFTPQSKILTLKLLSGGPETHSFVQLLTF